MISGAGGWQARAAGSASEGLRIVELVNNIMLELNSYLVSYSLEPPFLRVFRTSLLGALSLSLLSRSSSLLRKHLKFCGSGFLQRRTDACKALGRMVETEYDGPPAVYALSRLALLEPRCSPCPPLQSRAPPDRQGKPLWGWERFRSSCLCC